MTKIYYIAILLLFSALGISAQNLELNIANDLYANNKFDEATQKYEAIIASGYEASEVYFNLANAYFKQGALAKSILNYERAQLLDPRDEDVAFNLSMAQQQVVDKIEVIDQFFLNKWTTQLQLKFGSDTWAIISMLAFAALIGMAFLFVFTRTSSLKKIAFFMGITLVVTTGVSMNMAYAQKERLIERHGAIVLSGSVTVKGSPDSSGTELFILHEGSKVTITDKVGDWLEIKLLDGNIGWIEASHIEVI